MKIETILISDELLSAHLINRDNDVYAKLAEAMGEDVEVYRHTYKRTCHYGPAWYAYNNPVPFGAINIDRCKLNYGCIEKDDTTLKINIWNGDAWQQVISTQPLDLFSVFANTSFDELAQEIKQAFEEWKISQAEVLRQRLAKLESE